jgi:hypothetical protein
MTQQEKDNILTDIAEIPLSDPTMDSTRNLILAYLAERFRAIDNDIS